MAINLQLKVKVNSTFNSAVVSNVRNGIAVGDRVGTVNGAAGVNGLEGDLPDTSAGVAAGPQLAMREQGHIPAQPGDTGARGDVPARLQRTPMPHGALRPSTGPSSSSAAPAHQAAPQGGSRDTDSAIRAAATASGVDVNTMRGIASIESGMNPGSNRNRPTQYKGLYQLGHDEWRRNGVGDIYNAHDNAMATARMFEQHKAEFRSRYGREPTDRELYMIHQQGLGFYTRGVMTNIHGNPYPGMRGPQTHESFEAGWGRELERRREAFAARDRAAHPAPVAARVPNTDENAP